VFISFPLTKNCQGLWLVRRWVCWDLHTPCEVGGRIFYEIDLDSVGPLAMSTRPWIKSTGGVVAAPAGEDGVDRSPLDPTTPFTWDRQDGSGEGRLGAETLRL
jgi:hypothetical protein